MGKATLKPARAAGGVTLLVSVPPVIYPGGLTQRDAYAGLFRRVGLEDDRP